MRHAWTTAALAVGGLLAAGIAAPAAGAADDCPNAKVRAQQGVQHLPNCLAYEKVTPNNKNGALVGAEYGISADGSEAIVYSNTAISPNPLPGFAETSLASRGSDGWSLEPLTGNPLFGALRNMGPADFLTYESTLDDLRTMLFRTTAPYDPRDVGGGTAMITGDFYLRRADGSYAWLTAPRGFDYTMHQPVNNTLVSVRVAPDQSKLVFGVQRVMDPTIDPAERRHLWLWRGEDQPLELIDRMPDGSPSESTLLTGPLAPAVHRTSPDFKTVIFGATATPVASSTRRIYARVGVGTPDVRTVLVSASADGSVQCASHATLGGLTENGRWVRFSCATKLTDDAPASGGDYVRDLETGTVEYNPDGGPIVKPSPDLLPPASTPEALEWTRPDGTFRGFRTPDNNIWVENLLAGTETCATCSPNPEIASSRPRINGGMAAGATGRLGGRAWVNMVTPEGDLYFSSPVQLVPEDTNEFVDLYLAKNGKHYLLTSGNAVRDVEVGGVSLDGSTISFTTPAALVPEDQDVSADVYVLRRNGGFYRELQSAECSIGCQGPANVPSAVVAPLSVGFSGSGDLAEKDDDGAPITVSGSRSVRGTSLKVKVRTPGAGRVSVSGSGLLQASRSVKRASTTTMAARLSVRSQRTLRRKGSVRVKASVRFVPTDGTTQTKRVSLTFRRAASKKGSSRGVAAVSNRKAAR